MPELWQRRTDEENVILRLFERLQIQIILQLGIRVRRLFILKLRFLLLIVRYGPRGIGAKGHPRRGAG
jgi:hypothetical protein